MMSRHVVTVLAFAGIAWLAGCTSAPPAPDVTARATVVSRAAPSQPRSETGVLDGAAWRIDIPADWNGELVVNAHGYVVAGSPMRDPPQVPGGMQPLLDRGFAVAASDYSAQGWAIGEGIVDTERLRAHFTERFGAPRKTWLVGWSMGGLVALASAERNPRSWDGVVAMCPVAVSTGEMFARGALAPLAAFDALYPGVLPQAPGGLADPSLPGEADGEAVERAFAGDEARAAAFADRFGIARADAAASLWLYWVALRELATRAGGFPASSTAGADGTDGDEAALDIRIRRYTADPAATAYVQRTGALTGRAPVPVVVQANAVDPVVPARFSAGYAALAQAAGRGAQVRTQPPVGEGHCRFPPEAVVAAVEALRAR